MRLEQLQSAAREAKALAQTAEREVKEATEAFAKLKKDSRLAKMKLKRAKKESKRASKATRTARDVADAARRALARAAARSAKADAKVVKARKKISDEAGPAIVTPRKTRRARGAQRTKVTAVAKKRVARVLKSVRARKVGGSAPPASVGRPDVDFETEWSDADLTKTDAQP